MKISIKAKPNSREEKVERISDNNYIVAVCELPVKGRANLAVIKALAKHFKVNPYEVKIVSGFSSGNKIIEISMAPSLRSG